MYKFKDGSVMYGPGGYRKATMSRLGFEWCVFLNSNLMCLHRNLPKTPGAVLMVIKILVQLPITIPTAFWRDPMRFIWSTVTLPIFLLLVPFAALVSYYNRRDVFPMAYQWTHGFLAFGHRWAPQESYFPEIYEFCRLCGAYRKRRT